MLEDAMDFIEIFLLKLRADFLDITQVCVINLKNELFFDGGKKIVFFKNVHGF